MLMPVAQKDLNCCWKSCRRKLANRQRAQPMSVVRTSLRCCVHNLKEFCIHSLVTKRNYCREKNRAEQETFRRTPTTSHVTTCDFIRKLHGESSIFILRGISIPCRNGDARFRLVWEMGRKGCLSGSWCVANGKIWVNHFLDHCTRNWTGQAADPRGNGAQVQVRYIGDRRPPTQSNLEPLHRTTFMPKFPGFQLDAAAEPAAASAAQGERRCPNNEIRTSSDERILPRLLEIAKALNCAGNRETQKLGPAGSRAVGGTGLALGLCETRDYAGIVRLSRQIGIRRWYPNLDAAPLLAGTSSRYFGINFALRAK